ncbi:MAG TPA: 4-oxalocrotonate tautomerase [Pelomicrobium sp.]|nr:4-oxalocrotonate tautomerase [Pelomicrobium sp.]
MVVLVVRSAPLQWAVATSAIRFFHEDSMPFIHIELFEGRTREQKKALVESITRETVRALKCDPDDVEIVLREVKREEWATGGKFWSER